MRPTTGDDGEESFVRMRLFPGTESATPTAADFPGYTDDGEESFVRMRLFPGTESATETAADFPGYTDDGDCLITTVEQRVGERVDDLLHRSLLELATALRGVSPGTVVPQATLSWTPRRYQDGIILRPDEMAMLARFGGAVLIDTYTE